MFFDGTVAAAAGTGSIDLAAIDRNQTVTLGLKIALAGCTRVQSWIMS